MSLQIIFRVNGIRAAFIAAMGPQPAYRSPAYPAANTSASLIIKEGDGVLANVLFDCGEGVIASMVEAGLEQVTHCFLTHNHVDHIVGLDGLMVTQRATGGVFPLPVYCTEGTWRDGPLGRFPWLCGRPVALSAHVRPFRDPPEPALILHQLRPFQPVDLDLGIGLRVTPVPVYHGPSGVEPVTFIIEFGDPIDGTYRKIGLFWDQMHFIPRYKWEMTDTYYIGPLTDSPGWIPEHAALFDGLDEAFIDSSFLTQISYISHRSLSSTLSDFLPRLTPARAWVIHYDGTLDPGGALPPADLLRWIDANRAACPPDLPILLAEHGMTFSYTI